MHQTKQQTYRLILLHIQVEDRVGQGLDCDLHLSLDTQ